MRVVLLIGVSTVLFFAVVGMYSTWYYGTTPVDNIAVLTKVEMADGSKISSEGVPVSQYNEVEVTGWVANPTAHAVELTIDVYQNGEPISHNIAVRVLSQEMMPFTVPLQAGRLDQNLLVVYTLTSTTGSVGIIPAKRIALYVYLKP
jgi:hypothetical protein